MFHGTITALVTPFYHQEIDEEAFREHLERQVNNGVDGVVPAGTTGEAATLSFEEHRRVIAIAVDQVAGRVPVIAGTGSNNTRESIALTQAAKDLGADAALLISPYYNKPTQQGIYAHYKAVADAVHLPQILYNVPGRTHSHIHSDTVERLSHLSNIIGIKDATANMDYLTETMQACDGRINFFSGDDASVFPFMTIGGDGVISVVSNIAPKTMTQLTRAMREHDFITARHAHFALQQLNTAMFTQANPMPVKAACAKLGWMQNELRLPLTVLDDDMILRVAMENFDSGVESFTLSD